MAQLQKSSQSMDRFRTLFDYSSDAHIIVADSGIVDINEAAVRLLKCRSREEALSRHPSFFSPEFQPDGRRSDEKFIEMDGLARKRGFHRFEWMHRKSDGEELPVEVTLNAVDIDGKPALIAVWHDLTEIKQAEKRLQNLNQRMIHELESAAQFQQSLLPIVTPYSEKFRTSWFYKPCEELGGDSLNIFRIDDKHIGLYVLDVTGHGVASALLSVTATHFLSGFFKAYRPQNVVENMNRHFADEKYKNHTFTLVYGVMNLEDLTFIYTSAGHIGPIRVETDGKVEQFDGHGPPVGMLEDAEYAEGRIQFKRGDRLFLISDGVYEAKNKLGEDLGLDRVYTHLKKESLNQASLEYAVNSLARDTFRWTSPNKPDDDISIVGFEIR